MIRVDEDALICDFAETYNIYDYKGLPLRRAALFAVGLRDDSRIKMTLNDMQTNTEIMLLASMVDSLNFLVWSKTTDAEKGRNRPKSIFDILNPKESDTQGYASGEDFEKAREKLLNQPKGVD